MYINTSVERMPSFRRNNLYFNDLKKESSDRMAYRGIGFFSNVRLGDVLRVRNLVRKAGSLYGYPKIFGYMDPKTILLGSLRGHLYFGHFLELSEYGIPRNLDIPSALAFACQTAYCDSVSEIVDRIYASIFPKDAFFEFGDAVFSLFPKTSFKPSSLGIYEIDLGDPLRSSLNNLVSCAVSMRRLRVATIPSTLTTGAIGYGIGSLPLLGASLLVEGSLVLAFAHSLSKEARTHLESALADMFDVISLEMSVRSVRKSALRLIQETLLWPLDH